MTTPVGATAGNAAEAQREAGARERGGKADGFFTRKYGPLPGWGWATLAGVGALAYFWWSKRKNAQAATTDTSATDPAAADGTTSDQLASLQDEIDALQGEVASSTGGGTGTGGGPGGDDDDETGGGKGDKGDITVPKVTGTRLTAAAAKVRAAGLKVHTTPHPERGKPYRVKSQSPAGGKKVDRGSTVTLSIEKVTR